MPKLTAIVASLLVVLTSATPAFAEDSCAVQRKKDPKRACTLVIDGSALDGERIVPDGDRILAQAPVRFGSLVRVRTSMLDKMAKDVDRF